MEIYERNIALEWYRYGNEKKDDFFIRFMMYWIGFNWLYSQIPFGDERAKIKEFYRRNKEIFEMVDPFTLTDIRIFLEAPVWNEEKGIPQQGDFEKLKKKDGVALLALLMTLYQVRCNLFHGSKSLRNERDIALVKASANILGEYMKVLVADPQQSIGNPPYNPR